MLHKALGFYLQTLNNCYFDDLYATALPWAWRMMYRMQSVQTAASWGLSVFVYLELSFWNGDLHDFVG